jgi:hypothetical protein
MGDDVLCDARMGSVIQEGNAPLKTGPAGILIVQEQWNADPTGRVICNRGDLITKRVER